MNKTIKNYKGAEKGCGVVYSKGRKAYGNRKEYRKEYICGKPSLCGYCKAKKQTSKTALQEMKEVLEKFKTKGTHAQVLEEIETEKQKIQEVLEK